MVVTLFLLAVSSFALMGLFVAWLTIRTGLETRRRRASEQAAALDVALEHRRHLAEEIAGALREAAPALAAELDQPFFGGAGAAGRADRNARVAMSLERAFCGAEDAGVAPETVAGLRDRARDADGRVSAAARGYNAAVTDLNGALAVVPALLVARFSRIAPSPLLHVAGDADARPTGDPAKR